MGQSDDIAIVDAHHHLYNVDSGDLIDIELDLEQLTQQAKASLPAGVEMQSAEVVIRVRDKKTIAKP